MFIRRLFDLPYSNTQGSTPLNHCAPSSPLPCHDLSWILGLAESPMTLSTLWNDRVSKIDSSSSRQYSAYRALVLVSRLPSHLESVIMVIEKNGCGWDVSPTVIWKIIWCDVNNDFTREGRIKTNIAAAAQQQQSSLKNRNATATINKWFFNTIESFIHRVITLSRETKYLDLLVSAVCRIYCISLVKDPSWMMTTVLRQPNNDDGVLVHSWAGAIIYKQEITREEGK